MIHAHTYMALSEINRQGESETRLYSRVLLRDTVISVSGMLEEEYK